MAGFFMMAAFALAILTAWLRAEAKIYGPRDGDSDGDGLTE